jgi:flavin reductase (DIM6/NTAB) family NADH-FMN oxidoreductase RutF
MVPYGAGYGGGVTFDDLVGGLDYPMFVVTAYDGTSHAGCLVGFATQCSIDPQRFLVCLSKKNHTHGVAAGSPVLALHLLRKDQHDTAELFGSRTGDEVDKLARCAWTAGPEGVPVLDDCHGWFAGRVLERHNGGDHTVHLVEVVAAGGGGGGAVLTFDDVRDLEPGHEA